MTWMAEIVPNPVDPANGWAQLGAIGLIISSLIWYAKSSLARERERADKAEEQAAELHKFIRETLLPQNIESTLLHQQVTEVLGEALDKLADTRQKLSEVQRRSAAPRPGSRRVGE